MKYSKEQLAFILYNNRSIEGVVSNFLPDISDVRKLNSIDKYMKSFYKKVEERVIEVDSKKLNLEASDLSYTKEDLNSIKEEVMNAHYKLGGDELKWLLSRGISGDEIFKYKIGGLSNISDDSTHQLIGSKIHPLLDGFLKDGYEGGGIIIPLFDSSGNLINCAVRRISNAGKLKYTMSVPDVDVWGFEDIEEGDEIWICEGLFDMMAIRSLGYKAVSPSSASWSSLQIYKLLESKPSKINIWVDDDQSGLRTGYVLRSVFMVLGVWTETFISKIEKDASETIHIRGGNIEDDVERIDITEDMILKREDKSFDFLKYLEGREF